MIKIKGAIDVMVPADTDVDFGAFVRRTYHRGAKDDVNRRFAWKGMCLGVAACPQCALVVAPSSKHASSVRYNCFRFLCRCSFLLMKHIHTAPGTKRALATRYCTGLCAMQGRQVALVNQACSVTLS